MSMELRARFEQREVVRPQDETWRPSPMAGVERRMLDRIGDEVARATSIVRYAASARFSAHTHGGGEESSCSRAASTTTMAIIRTYVRNRIGTAHAPWGPDGAVLFVKLWQFARPIPARRDR